MLKDLLLEGALAVIGVLWAPSLLVSVLTDLPCLRRRCLRGFRWDTEVKFEPDEELETSEETDFRLNGTLVAPPFPRRDSTAR